jgi:PIN domain nuclease of toxin-antitoxin system
VSAVSPWEIAIKQSLGKLDGPQDLAERVRDSQFTGLPLTAGHGVRADRLSNHHRDPFDRLLIAQARIEGMTLVTRDKWIPAYDVPVMSV